MTRRVILTRDVVFLRKSYGEWNADKDEATAVKPTTLPDDDDSDDDEEPININHHPIVSESEDEEPDTFFSAPSHESTDDNEESDISEGDTSEAENQTNPKLLREMRKLDASYNPDAHKVIESTKLNEEPIDDGTGRVSDVEGTDELSNLLIATDELSNLLMDITKVASSEKPTLLQLPYDEPKTWEQAWYHPDPYQRKMWRAAIMKKWNDMKKRNVWIVQKRCDMPKDRRCVKSKWVFKLKRNGVFRARIVACGYSQIPGVDFEESYSPVMNDITLRILLVIWIVMTLKAIIADVETAFLYGKLLEVIFMECPPGMMGTTKDDVLRLLMCIYGLVQAAARYYAYMAKTLRSMGFKGGDVDPCLFVKWINGRVCFVGLYVDDNLIIGHPELVDDTIKQLRQKGLILKISDLDDYLSCHIVLSKDKRRAWLGQPHLIASIVNKFGSQIRGLRQYKTPGTPGLSLVRDVERVNPLSTEKHSMYRSGVGLLGYLVKHSRPDLANMQRELSKSLDCPTEASYKELLRGLKYVVDTKEFGLKIEPSLSNVNEPWRIVVYSDSDYATDPDTRRSTSGYILYLREVPIAWKSKAQQSVSLSSTEAEWIALSEAVKEIKFVVNLLESMKIKVNYPIKCRVDNIGAIFMSQNVTTTSRAKHIDIRTKFVREYVEDGKIKIVFVRSGDNDSDIMTKNVQGDLHDKHSKKLIGKQH
eukprot:g3736.t1 g3736   contig13:32484-34808(-)